MHEDLFRSSRLPLLVGCLASDGWNIELIIFAVIKCDEVKNSKTTTAVSKVKNELSSRNDLSLPGELTQRS